MDRTYIEDIVDALANESCIILLGPEFSSPTHESVQDEIIAKAKEDAGLEIKADPDGFYQIKSSADRVRFYRVFRSYIKKNYLPRPIHQRILELKTHLIISFSPDEIMKEMFQEHYPIGRFSYFNKKKYLPIEEAPSVDRPLVYNLFGSVSNTDSLLLTQDDLFDFIFKILKENVPLPQEIESCIQEGKLFLFLGFDFEHWYLRILLKLFQELYDEGFGVVNELGAGLSNQVKLFYSENFDLIFVRSGLNQFVEEIYEACKESSEDLLRDIAQPKAQSVLSLIRERIVKNEVKEAIELLESKVDRENIELMNELIQIGSRLNMYEKQVRLETITPQQAAIEFNRIKQSVLNLAGEFESM